MCRAAVVSAVRIPDDLDKAVAGVGYDITRQLGPTTPPTAIPCGCAVTFILYPATGKIELRAPSAT